MKQVEYFKSLNLIIPMNNLSSSTVNDSRNYRTLIDALRSTSKRLSQEGVEYQWGHMGQ